MHSKMKGNIAQSSVVLVLQKNGFNVFSELGDLSRIDLIAEKNGILKKIQIKYCGTGNGTVGFKTYKNGPDGYSYSYSSSDIDWFAVYDSKTEKIGWVKSEEACKNSAGVTLRLLPPKKGIRLIDDYDINGFLRDFTQGTEPPINGEDKVQTTTSKDGSGN